MKKIVIERVLQMAVVLVTFPERKVIELTTFIECKNGQTPSCKIKRIMNYICCYTFIFLER